MKTGEAEEEKIRLKKTTSPHVSLCHLQLSFLSTNLVSERDGCHDCCHSIEFR